MSQHVLTGWVGFMGATALVGELFKLEVNVAAAVGLAIGALLAVASWSRERFNR